LTFTFQVSKYLPRAPCLNFKQLRSPPCPSKVCGAVESFSQGFFPYPTSSPPLLPSVLRLFRRGSLWVALYLLLATRAPPRFICIPSGPFSPPSISRYEYASNSPPDWIPNSCAFSRCSPFGVCRAFSTILQVIFQVTGAYFSPSMSQSRTPF